MLTAGIDIQKDHFWLSIRGWGDYEASWGVCMLRIEDWAGIEEFIIKRAYTQLETGIPMKVVLACIDSAHRGQECYTFCRNYPDIIRPVRGDNQRGLPWRSFPIDRDPYDGKPLPGSLLRWHWDKELFMDRMNRYLTGWKDHPAQWWLPEDADEEALEQLCAWVKKRERGKRGAPDKEEWVKRDDMDHLWFCACYEAVAADMAGVDLLGEEPEEDDDSYVNEDAEHSGWNRGGGYAGWGSRM